MWAGRVTLRDRAGRPVQADLRACPLLDADGHTQWLVQALVPPESGNTVALALQHSLLQHPVPVQQAVETAVRYLPADPQAGVGGDWFDVIPLSGARVALVVGDVVGHGVHASAAMGRLRTAVRALPDVDLPPDELLAALDHLILDEWRDGLESGEIGATCLYAVYDPVTCRCSAAGTAIRLRRWSLRTAPRCERWGTRHTPRGKTLWTEQPLAPHDTEQVSFAVDA